jgi:hypothetical protein
MSRILLSAMIAGTMALATGSAFAQTQIGGRDISAEDLPKVQAQCDTLNAKAMDGTASATTSEAEPTSSGTNDGVDSGNNTATAGIDLSLVTLEECKAAGLVK